MATNEYEAEVAGYVNASYIPSRHASTISIPGEYRKSIEEGTESVKSNNSTIRIEAIPAGGIDQNGNVS